MLYEEATSIETLLAMRGLSGIGTLGKANGKSGGEGMSIKFQPVRNHETGRSVKTRVLGSGSRERIPEVALQSLKRYGGIIGAFARRQICTPILFMRSPVYRK